MEFNLWCALTKDVLCQYFYKGLRPSIWLWINKEDQDLDGWNALIKRATRAKAKAKIQASASRDLDQQCHWGKRPVYTSAAKAQAPKDLRPEEPKVRGPDSEVSTALLRSNNSEFSAKARRKKKKDYCQNNQQDRQGQKGSTPATGINAAEPKKSN